jgi:Fingers domain of DNA polymerase lambda
LDSSDHVAELFMGIYGVGKTTAIKFVMQGFRTLQDLIEKADLNDSQRIGIKLYEVLLSIIILITGFRSENSTRGGRTTFSYREGMCIEN